MISSHPRLAVFLGLAVLGQALPNTTWAQAAAKSKGAAKPREEAFQPLRDPRCTGEYADFLTDLLPANGAFEKSPDANYVYCLRTVATYEHVFYGRGSKLKRTYLKVQSHGTGFAYKVKDGTYFLATNEHVAEYPEVTDDDHPVDGIPSGSRKVREVVKIVANENDDYEPGMIPLTKVLADSALDVAILQTKHPLKVMPYKIGKSSAIRAGNAVMVRGYPLGVFPASSSGKVTNPYQEDSDARWEHVDFVTDALLNPGNSGSPTLAVSCRTGELELVGIYHAHYTGGTGLGLVIGIDGLRDVLETLKPPRRDVAPAQSTFAEDRRKGLLALSAQNHTVYFPFAERTVRAELLEDSSIRFAMFRDFPLLEEVQMALIERGGQLLLELPAHFSKPMPVTQLDPDLRDPLERLRESLWRTLRVVEEFRQAEQRAGGQPDPTHRISELKTTVVGHLGEQKDLLSTIDFESDNIAWPAAAKAHPDPAASPPLESENMAADGGPRPGT